MPQPETVLVERIRKALIREYPEAFVVKLHGGPYQTAGLPDLLVIVDGTTVGLEVKRPQPGESAEHARGRVTARQQATLEAMRRAGAWTGVPLTVEEALAIVAEAVRTGNPLGPASGA